MYNFWFRLSFIILLFAVLTIFFGAPVEGAYFITVAAPLVVFVRFVICKVKKVDFSTGRPIR
jgi:hypothetical protein